MDIYEIIFNAPVVANGDGGGGSALLLDTYSGAAAAYSLRKLRTAYAGSCIRVRRSSDSAEQDIGFASGVLDTATLLSFCGAGDGFVTTWYDQSGNARNATQATSTAQPRVAIAGVVQTQGTRSAIRFDGNSDYLTLASSAISGTALALFAVLQTDADPAGSAGESGLGTFGTDQSTHYPWTDGTVYCEFGTNARKTCGNPTLSLTTNHLLTVQSYASDFSLRLNGNSQFSTATNTVAFPTTCLIGQGGSYSYKGRMAEWVIYTSNQSSNRVGIESNINTHYTLF